MKTLMVVFSPRGKTYRKAREIKNIVDSDLYEIYPDKSYGGFFHNIKVASQEYQSSELIPIKKEIEYDILSYDRVLVGYPVWCARTPQVVVSFLKTHEFANTKIYPFITSAWTKPDKVVTKLKEELPNLNIHGGYKANHVKGKRVIAWLYH
ncbi:MAG: hypothetical protein LUC31_00400 [Coprobacillus sp.]|nr:hypothetical protein [Coprobacillus sp.]